ncbi:quinone-dependent dihydroorotate dehydrogenase [Brumimicrobium glaciale]|uniref:Dihydroorotate dehydrogenase (quinone) n=1 Tax=Brumimicrobium glaciale TaxID=200475 RepID=A0A4Q4KHI4_9FLAO|nr:quinone-dependent dihydroorotate dehydrogenase [Brumimicrobium glaciale]RYM32077.1 quinone-dependent dihydroorotate dehydrogenase [Brumimicrobium glaciale]
MYALIKRIFFLFDPEKIHHFTFKLIKTTLAIPGMKSLWKKWYVVEDKRLERELFGLKFKNPVGLAAGFDKNGKLFNELEYTGFGFIEVGTVTPKAQEGNPKKRLFRLIEDEAIINRMGFNNDGLEELIKNLKNRKTKLIIGGNIGKNKDTPNENAVDDYVKCFDALYQYVDYFVVNVSSPNTPNLRELQDKEPLTALLNTLKKLNASKHIQRPILLKIAPDLTNEQLDDIIEIVGTTKIDGIIATNTTIDRSKLQTKNIESIGAGGLSGKPLTKRSTEVVRYLHQNSNGSFPIIGVGGIHSAEDALEKFEAGASLVQLYTGFIYEGPQLIRKINEALLKS